MSQKDVYSKHSQMWVETLIYKRGMTASDAIEVSDSGACVTIGPCVPGYYSPEFHAQMQVLARAGVIPPSCASVRASNSDAFDARVVPPEFVVANREGYIGPTLPAPPGFLWKLTTHERRSKTKTKGWMLRKDSTSTHAADTLAQMKRIVSIYDSPLFSSALLRGQAGVCEGLGGLEYDKKAYHKAKISRYAEACET